MPRAQPTVACVKILKQNALHGGQRAMQWSRFGRWSAVLLAIFGGTVQCWIMLKRTLTRTYMQVVSECTVQVCFVPTSWGDAILSPLDSQGKFDAITLKLDTPSVIVPTKIWDQSGCVVCWANLREKMRGWLSLGVCRSQIAAVSAWWRRRLCVASALTHLVCPADLGRTRTEMTRNLQQNAACIEQNIHFA